MCRLTLLVLALVLTIWFSPTCAVDLTHQLQDLINLLKGKRVGFLTNPTGVDQSLTQIADILAHHADVKVTAFFSPEHGLRGDQ